MTRRADPRETRLPVPAGELPAFTPVPRQTNRHDGWTEDRQRRFIEALADTGSVEAACRAVNMSTVGAYYLRRQKGAESFRKAWAAALDLGVQRIEDVAMDRALNGVEQPVYSYGKLVGTRMVHNDRLLMFMLRNRAPERFTEGRAKGLNAIGKMDLDRLKKQWRKEWEAERAAAATAEEDAHAEKINAMLSKMRERRLALMSPRTRAAYEEYCRLTDEDEKAGYRCWDDPEHDNYVDRDADWGEDEDEPLALPPPDWRKREVEESEDDAPRVRRLKDDTWE
ncbi:hypothetical protein P8Q88_04210 [Qipengyuania sp. XHP0207]|uniref:hypothetical protein n=1 Tax=Qipengyuania sp. XHP0207 TaxID=3038078 RepID=UPI00241E2A79|nr:hypothetical protein [Qipengyuania sp. XHP0207]MDG5747374.1 hypothetical protein [Qipengyuania sp. XHP0207]